MLYLKTFGWVCLPIFYYKFAFQQHTFLWIFRTYHNIPKKNMNDKCVIQIVERCI